MQFERSQKKEVKDKLCHGDKVVILYGPRQAGKTTLAEEILSELNIKTLNINGDERKYQDVFSSQDYDKMKSVFSGYDCLFIDEAQRIPNIGINLKIIHDQTPSLKLFVTGSSSFELANTINEPLTGRKWTFTLYPATLKELSNGKSPFEIQESYEMHMRFGTYPEIATTINHEEKIQKIAEIAESYLYKDVLETESIKHANKIDQLLRLLAYQVGSQVSLSELASALDINKKTVERYIDLLEKSFVLFRLSGFSRNLRKEVTKSDKFYFVDLGIRNAIIGNFNPLKDRNDTGQLWENFIISERFKKLNTLKSLTKPYFWRTYTGAEIDYIEESATRLSAYEIKWKKPAKAPKSWSQEYPEATFQTIDQNTSIEFLK